MLYNAVAHRVINEYYKVMLVKDCKLNLKELNQKDRIVEGYFSSFDVVDSDNDIIRKGAFAKSIQENGPASQGKRIKHLFNHWSTAGVLEKLFEDEFGLGFRSKIGNHALGNDVLSMYMDGIITEHSIGFQLVDGKISQTENTREILEVKLWEGSSLDRWGANMNTPVIKSQAELNLYAKEWTKRYDSIIKALRNRTNYTDETYEEFVIQLEVMKSTFENVLKELKPEASTLIVPEPLKKEIDWDIILKTITVKK